MSKEAARRKRAKAIKTLRECGLTDAEIAAELGHSLDSYPEESEIIDVEVISVDDETLENAEPVTRGVKERPASLPVRIALPTETDSNTTRSFSKYSDEWWKSLSPKAQQRRCRAHSSRTGERCKQQALIGSTVCRWHGGAAPHVKAAARRRLENAADRMARNLLGLATEADSEPVRLGATNSALDRVGITKPTEVVLSQGRPYEEVFDEIAGGSRDQSRRARGFLEPDAAGYEAESVSSVRPTQSNGPSPTQPPAQARPGGSFVEPSQPSDYSDLEPEYVGRGDLSPTYQHRADPSSKDAEALLTDASGQEPRPSVSGRQRHAQRPADPRSADAGSRSATAHHITGDDALRVAAQFTREQLALESPHKRYKRPS